MIQAKRWTIDVYLDERDGHTHAEARLRPGDTVTLTGVGRARLNPRDADVPEIGDELAVARALTDLGHQLLVTSSLDIEAITHETTTLEA